MYMVVYSMSYALIAQISLQAPHHAGYMFPLTSVLPHPSNIQQQSIPARFISTAVLTVACAPHVAPLSLVVLPSRRGPRATLAIAARVATLHGHFSPGSNSPGPRTLPLAEDGGKNVSQTKEAGDDRVSNDSTFARRHESCPLRKTKTQTAVDNSEDDGDTTEPDVAV